MYRIILTICGVRVRHVELTKPKVTKSDVPRVIQQNVFGLQISANCQSAPSLYMLKKNLPVDYIEGM